MRDGRCGLRVATRVGVYTVDMASSHRSLAILFVDISGSTGLYARHGDDKARRMSAECLQLIGNSVVEHGGSVVKTMGDSVMSTFLTADDAFACASMVRSSHTTPEIALHAGFHFGPVIEEAGDIFGDAVNVASRVASLAQTGEIMTTDDTVSCLSPENQEETRLLDTMTVRGKDVPLSVYLVVSSEDDNTAYRRRLGQSLIGKRAVLELIYRGNIIVHTEEQGEFVMGRIDECQLLVDHDYVSRRHATIECNRGKYFLNDHSTNGTYVLNDRDQRIVLRRELIQLLGTGTISLGGESENHQEHVIQFRAIMPS